MYLKKREYKKLDLKKNDWVTIISSPPGPIKFIAKKTTENFYEYFTGNQKYFTT